MSHKNFMNLLGYCEEEHPFTRVMVFEYAPNGTLFEHLHGKRVAVMSFSVSSVTKTVLQRVEFYHYDFCIVDQSLAMPS